MEAPKLELPKITPLPAPKPELAKASPPPSPSAPATIVPPAAVEELPGKIVTKDGWVRPATGLFRKPGSHQLMSTDKPLAMVLCFLASTVVNLDQYEGRHVRITGAEHWQKGWNQPLLQVKQVELMK